MYLYDPVDQRIVDERVAQFLDQTRRHLAGSLSEDDFRPLRDNLIWQFNRLFWQRLGDWESASGRGFEAGLPGGVSDGNHPQAIADSVGDFWTLLRDLEARGQLPAEIFCVEIGVGPGTRARQWLDRFKALEEQCGSQYYSRLRVLLGDYSPRTLDAALETMGRAAMN